MHNPLHDFCSAGQPTETAALPATVMPSTLTVHDKERVPSVPEVNVIEGPVVDPVMVPLEIDQEYEAPLCAGTLAVTPVAPGGTKGGAVIVALGGF